VCSAEVRAVEVRPTEVRFEEIRAAEVRPAEVRIFEFGPAEVYPLISLLGPPCVPRFDSLLNQGEVLLIWHK
jgi:hypothetical protein